MNPTVIVAKGGSGLESPVSRASANRVCHALTELGFAPVAVEADSGLLAAISKHQPAFVFVCMHGKGGEDGTIQDLLQAMNIPYTGADAAASALCFDKAAFKRLLREREIPTPEFVSFTAQALGELGGQAVYDQLVATLGLPLVIKPARQGSSFGIKFVANREQFPAALLSAFSYCERIVIERFIAGQELAVTLLGDAQSPTVLDPVLIETPYGFYDHEAHYGFGTATLTCPPPLSASILEAVRQTSVKVWRAAGARDLARVDLILDEHGVPQVLEMNTIPGMTESGPTPTAAASAGMSFAQFIETVCGRCAKLACESAPRAR